MPDQHPLRHTWALWHCPNLLKLKIDFSDNEATKKATRRIDTFKTVEELWSIVGSFPPATKMPVNDVLCFFRDGVEPFWEDQSVKAGGRLSFKLVPSSDVDRFVLEIHSHVVGGFLDHEMNSTDLCAGIRILRKETKRDAFVKVELWFVDWSALADIQKYIVDLAAQCNIDNLDANTTNDKF